MDNLLKLKPANLDEYQMNNMTFDVEKQAWRVAVVDGVTLNVDKINMPEMKFPEQQVIQVPVIVKETDVRQINVPVIIKEIQIERVEVPIVVKEIETVYIDRPVIVTEIRIVEIEKPIIVKEIEIKEVEVSKYPAIIQVCMIVQTLFVIGTLITKFILKG